MTYTLNKEQFNRFNNSSEAFKAIMKTNEELLHTLAMTKPYLHANSTNTDYEELKYFMARLRANKQIFLYAYELAIRNMIREIANIEDGYSEDRGNKVQKFAEDMGYVIY